VHERYRRQTDARRTGDSISNLIANVNLSSRSLKIGSCFTELLKKKLEMPSLKVAPTAVATFFACDLEFSPMTLTFEFELDDIKVILLDQRS